MAYFERKTQYGGANISLNEIADMGKYSVDDQC